MTDDQIRFDCYIKTQLAITRMQLINALYGAAQEQANIQMQIKRSKMELENNRKLLELQKQLIKDFNPS